MKLWRNSEGREFPVGTGGEYCWAHLERMLDIPPDAMKLLGYELVDASEPAVGTEGAEEFEVVCKSVDYGTGCLRSDRIRPGKTYVVREKR